MDPAQLREHLVALSGTSFLAAQTIQLVLEPGQGGGEALDVRCEALDARLPGFGLGAQLSDLRTAALGAFPL